MVAVRNLRRTSLSRLVVAFIAAMALAFLAIKAILYTAIFRLDGWEQTRDQLVADQGALVGLATLIALALAYLLMRTHRRIDVGESRAISEPTLHSKAS